MLPLIWSTIALLLAAPLLGQQRVPALTPSWIALYSEAMIDWAENENRLNMKALCPQSKYSDSCWDENLAAKPFVTPLYAGPSRSAAVRGSILVLVTPGRGLKHFYIAPGAKEPTPFVPDMGLTEWGEGYQTIRDRQGDWFKLPEAPFPRDTWFSASDLGEAPRVRGVEGIVDSPWGSIVILELGQQFIRARPEQPADMWCQDGQPPPLKPWTELRIPLADLYDARGHLLLTPAYPEGC